MNKNRFYNDKKFLGSMHGRPLRILSEYLGPLSSLQKNKITDTIVFFGSARMISKSDYYKKARDLAYKLTKWNMKTFKDDLRFVITTGGGPGIMEAANKGAKEAGIVVCPGGVGTLDELFDVLTLLQSKKITRKIPIVLFGTKYWDGLIDWDRMISNNVISSSDLKLFMILDSVDETFDYLIKNMQK